MKAFIYEKYGYYVKEEDATSFVYEGWFFKIEISPKSDMALRDLRYTLEVINSHFDDYASDIVLSKDHHYVTNSEYGMVCLVAIKIGDCDVDVIRKMHNINLNNNTHLSLEHIRKLWMKKIDVIQERIIPSLDINDDNYNDLSFLVNFALYQGENAVAYLLDMIHIYTNKVQRICLSHKRIYALNSLNIFNPFNYVFDNIARDYSQLYIHDLISFQDLIMYLEKDNFDSFSASYLFVRCLFPSRIFDCLEDYYELNKNIKEEIKKLSNEFDNTLYKLKRLHKYLVEKYNIKSISYLEN